MKRAIGFLKIPSSYLFLFCNQPLFFQFIALICCAFLRRGFFCILFLISYRYELILFRSFSDQEWLITVIVIDIFQIILDECLVRHRFSEGYRDRMFDWMVLPEVGLFNSKTENL